MQDGGAVLGFAYHDLMARLKVLGPDNAWRRLQETLHWFDEVQTAGDYRKYYDGKTRDGSLQGGGTPGGLGLDHEFFESVLVPQVMLNGFLGFRPAGDGFSLNPSLPSSWPGLTIDRIRFHDATLRVQVTAKGGMDIQTEGGGDQPLIVRLPEANYQVNVLRAADSAPETIPTHREGAFSVARLHGWDQATIRIERLGAR